MAFHLNMATGGTIAQRHILRVRGAAVPATPATGASRLNRR